MDTGYNFEKLESNLRSPEALLSTNPVMLALSTFKHSDKAIEVAIDKASQCKKLVIVYGREVNLWLYFMETDIGLFPGLKEQCEKELLTEIEQQWEEKVEAVANRARAEGLQVTIYVRAKSFKKLCLEIAEKEKPLVIITTRTLRPAWIRSLFRSPADYLASQKGCSVIEA
ncbi:MAG: universal stress protein [Deltaproteobacteria bacterium]|nr:universal stress protein [Deltaproteobacteria bacterium]